MGNSGFLSVVMIFLVIIFVNVVFLTEYDNVFKLKEKFVANDSTHILFVELGSSIVSDYDGDIHKTDNISEYIKFKNAIKNNDTIYVYNKYKGLIPIINWPLIKIGGNISTEIKY